MKIILFFLFFTFIFTKTSYSESKKEKTFTLNDNIYLNACGGNPQEYKAEPLNIHNIITEVPNKIVSLKKSKYDRSFQTLAISSLKFNNENYKISVSNFRDLVIKNNKNEVLAERKISGASSIYEIKHKDQVVAWGVGWNKYCDEEGSFKKRLDFSVLRIFVPILKNNKIEIEQEYFPVNISKNYSSFKISNDLVISVPSTLWGDKLGKLYYTDNEFYKISGSDGIQYITEFSELENNIDIYKLRPFEIVTLLAKYHQLETLEKFTKENFDQINKDFYSRFEFSEEINRKIAIAKKTCFSGKKFSNINELAKYCYAHPSYLQNAIMPTQVWLYHHAKIKDLSVLFYGNKKKVFQDMIRAEVTDEKFDLWDEGEKISLSEEFLDSISHPQNFRLKKIDDFKILINGCMYKFCSQKGFIMFDFDVTGLIRSKNDNEEEDWVIFSKYLQSYADLPKRFFYRVREWQKEISMGGNEVKKPSRIRFINRYNEIIEIKQDFDSSTVGKPWIGVKLYFYKDNVVISNVEDQSPAKKSGIIIGDKIIAINNEDVKNVNDVSRIKFKYSIGEEIILRIIRDNKKIEKKLVLGDMPKN